MRFKTVSYLQTFPLGQFANEKISVEIELNEGDDAREAGLIAKNFVIEFHKTTNPQIYNNLFNDFEQLPVNEEKPQTVEERIIHGIKTCKELKVLETYQLLAKKYPNVLEEYNRKFNELCNK